MARSLPERTVDAWVAASVTGRYPTARLWAPTQLVADPQNPDNWDFGVNLGNGKAFIFEDKATEPSGGWHRIDIDLDQLDWYCDVVEPGYNVPVYYVLPKPPWHGPPTGSPVVPDQAVQRIASQNGPFADWAYVIRSSSLRVYLGAVGKQSVNTRDLPIANSETLTAFLTALDGCTRGRRVGPDVVEAEPFEPDAQPPQDRGDRDAERFLRSATAVFIPADQLAGWGPVEPEGDGP